MDATPLHEMFLYWKLKELEDLRWSGTLYFTDGQRVTGRLFINNGYLSWGEAAGQTNSLFSAMQTLAQIDADDIRFADAMYREQQKEKNFVTVLQSSGIIGYWTLRECMRAHLCAAVLKIAENPGAHIHEDEEKVVEASQHVFTIDELGYGRAYFNGPLPDLVTTHDVAQAEIRTRAHGLVLKWPEQSDEDKVAAEITQVHREYRAAFEDFKPTAISYHYSHGTYTVIGLRDVFESTLVVFTHRTTPITRLVSLVEKMPAAFVMQVAEATIPVRDVADGNRGL